MVDTNKTKLLRVMDHRIFLIYFNGRSIEDLEQFMRIDSVVSADYNTYLENVQRINSTKSTFVVWSEIWGSAPDVIKLN